MACRVRVRTMTVSPEQSVCTGARKHGFCVRKSLPWKLFQCGQRSVGVGLRDRVTNARAIPNGGWCATTPILGYFDPNTMVTVTRCLT